MMKIPGGFVPNEDQGYYFVVFTLPDGASLERTDLLMHRAEQDLKSIPGVQEVITMGGLNLLTNAYTSNNGRHRHDEAVGGAHGEGRTAQGHPDGGSEEILRLSGGRYARLPATSDLRLGQRRRVRF
jgi:multidrug efflux pump subunit AcrB